MGMAFRHGAITAALELGLNTLKRNRSESSQLNGKVFELKSF